MSEQLKFKSLGGDTVTLPKRGRHYVEPRGYAMPPGTGPKGETCGSCRNLVRIVRSNVYPKCKLTRSHWTHSRRTDVLVRAPACSKWERRT